MKLNRAPYFDDFSERKNYLKVLFNPAKAVQPRELTQTQSIFENQCSSFASNIFKNGTQIDGESALKITSKYITLTSLQSTPVLPTYPLSVDINTVDLTQVKAVGATSGATAVILFINDLLQLFYSPQDDKEFVQGEYINVYNDITFIAKYKLASTDFSGTSELWIIPESTFFIKDNFVDLSSSLLSVPAGVDSYKLGLDVVESAANYEQESSLLDNAMDAPSYLAPGADRYQINLIPTIRPIDEESDQDFITLAIIENGILTYSLRKTEYSKLMDTLAERTYDESGNYVVSPFKITLREHLRDSVYLDGKWEASEGGDSSKYIIDVSAGKAYINGYEVEKIASTEVVANKSVDSTSGIPVTGNFSGLTYIKIVPATNSAFYERVNRENLFSNKKVLIYDGPIVNKRASGAAIGEFYGIDTELVSGSVYKIYCIGLKMYSGKNFISAKSIEYYEDTVPFSAAIQIEPSLGVAQVFNSNSNGLVWEVTKNRLPDALAPDIYGTLRKCSTLTLNGDGEGTLSPTFVSGEGFGDFDATKFIGGTVAGNVFTPVLLNSTTCSITSNRASMTIALGASYANKSFVIYYSVIKKLVRKQKNLNQRTETLTLSSGALTLNCYDLGQIISVVNSSGKNVTSKFKFRPSPHSYTTCKVWSDGSVTSGAFTITYKYYTHTVGNYFDINSYPTSFVPTYNGKSLGDCIDFRPIIQTTSEISNVELPLSGGVFRTVVSGYLPRTDTLVLKANGDFAVRQGSGPSINEIPLYQLIQSPNTVSVSSIRIKAIKNSRYTMQDIGEIETRLKNADYFAKFSLVESILASMQIKDTDGINRYKNGILSDDFSTRGMGNITNPEFRASFDHEEKVVRPSFNRFNIRFELDSSNSSPHIKLLPNNKVMINYDEEVFIKQPFATKAVAITPFIKESRKGTVTLSPATDVWFDSNYIPSIDNSNSIITDGKQLVYGTWRPASPLNTLTYIRSQLITFRASGLKPGSNIYVFFDSVPVSTFCRPLSVSSPYGTTLVVDSAGDCSGEFLIPEKTFLSGEKLFRLTSDSINSVSSITYAETVFRCKEILEEDTLEVGINDTRLTQAPLAQSFHVGEPCFITAVDLYFYRKVPTDSLFLRIMSSSNGFPGKKVLVEQMIKGDSLIVSDDASKPTRIILNVPVFVNGPADYMLLLGGSNNGTRAWVSRIGNKDVQNDSLVDSQPNVGSLYKGSSAASWLAVKEECLKFSLYRANFKSRGLTLGLKSKQYEDDKISVNPFETQYGLRQVRVHCPSHALSVGDTIKPEIIVGDKLYVLMTSTNLPAIGQIITSTSGSATITSVTQESDGTLALGIKKLNGQFIEGETFSTDKITLDSTVAEKALGKISSTIAPTFNGIPLRLLNEGLIVREVDSMNSVIIEVLTPATSTGYTGGNVILNVNKRYDAFALHGIWNTAGIETSWEFQGLGSSVLDTFYQNNYVRQPSINISSFEDTVSLLRPLKVANSINEHRNLNTGRNIVLTGTFVTDSAYISPVIDISTFSMTGIYNNVDISDSVRYNVVPNSNRFYDETTPESGILSYKYITNEFVLKDPALDMKILVQIHKPQDADFDIYLKTRTPWNTASMSTILWTKITGIKKDFVCSEENEFKEVSFILSDIMPDTYGDTEFNVFQIKLVGTGINTSQPILFKSLRAIALT